MKSILLSLVICSTIISLSTKVSAQYTTEDSAMVRKIADNTMQSTFAYDNLTYLCKNIGHRLSGSPQSVKAIEWAQKALKNAGADTVWLQPVRVPVWVRGKETLKIQFDNQFENIEMLSLGNTIGTDGKVLEAPIIMFNSMADLANASVTAVKDKIVFLNIKFPRSVLSTFDGYGSMFMIRWDGAGLASSKGAKALIIRSISTNKEDIPHTGAAHYRDTVPAIPAVAIGNVTADRIERAIQQKSIKAQLLSNCKMNGTIISYNVIGELKGSVEPDKYLLVGGHLDSWDVGEGAHDDGTGCVQSIQVLKTWKDLQYKPKYTLRVVLFMNEENGNNGGKAYADSARAKKEYHVFALESDAGGFTPRGIGMIVPKENRNQAISWMPLLQPFGMYELSKEGSGVDIGPLKKQGVKVGELLPDNQRYFDIHHCKKDVLEAVNERELLLGASGISSFLYLVDQYWQ